MGNKTIEFLTKEVETLTEARDGVGKAWNLLKRENRDNENLRELYYEFDSRLKDYQISIDALNEYYLQMSASC